MNIVNESARSQGKELGVEVVDVRIKKINLPPEVSSAVYDRMRTERERVARELRSQGAEAAERIRASADRERTILLADAYRESEQIRGEGDGKSAEIYGQAYGKDPDFYAFYRSLGAYRNSFKGNNDVLLLKPDSEFFSYFSNSGSAGVHRDKPH
jgi:membrane protease subunit HflC